MHPENIPEGMDRSRGKENCDEIRYAFFVFREIEESGRTSFTVCYLDKKHELLHGLASMWDNA